jgi:hypothetical protein
MASSVFPFMMGIATAAAIAAGFAATHVDMRPKPVDRIAQTMAVLPQPALPVKAAAIPTTSGWAPPVIPIEETLDRHAPDQSTAKPAAPSKPDVKQPPAPKPVKKVKRDTRERDAQRARAQAYGYHAFGADEFRNTQRGQSLFGWR